MSREEKEMDKEKKSPSRPKRKTTGKPGVYKRARPVGQNIQGIYGDSPMNRPEQILPKEIQISKAKSGKKVLSAPRKMKEKIFESSQKKSHAWIASEREKILDRKRRERNTAKTDSLAGFKRKNNPAVEDRNRKATANKMGKELIRGKKVKETRCKR